MAIAKDDNDARRAWCKDKCLTYWGQEPTIQELDILAWSLATTSADDTLSHIADHAHAVDLRNKRGW